MVDILSRYLMFRADVGWDRTHGLSLLLGYRDDATRLRYGIMERDERQGRGLPTADVGHGRWSVTVMVLVCGVRWR